MPARIETFRTMPAPAPGPDGPHTLVLLHGRGSNEEDLQGLRPWVGDGLTLVTPRAPFPGAPWGYGPGWAWYRYLQADQVDAGTLEESLEAVDRFVEALPEVLGHDPGRLVLGGFSQGGTLSLAWALTRPGQVSGVVNLSGFLVAAPQVEEALEGAEGLPVFWGHGRMDPAIPFALAERGRGALLEAGVALEAHDHPAGHTLTTDEISRLARWMGEVLGESVG